MERLERELKKLIEARIEELRNNVAAGYIDDIAVYKRQTGQIEGLRASLELLEQALSNIKQQ